VEPRRHHDLLLFFFTEKNFRFAFAVPLVYEIYKVTGQFGNVSGVVRVILRTFVDRRRHYLHQ
jgi:hypothetical protein